MAKLLIRSIVFILGQIEYWALLSNDHRLADKCIMIRDALREVGWMP